MLVCYGEFTTRKGQEIYNVSCVSVVALLVCIANTINTKEAGDILRFDLETSFEHFSLHVFALFHPSIDFLRYFVDFMVLIGLFISLRKKYRNYI